MQKFTADIEMLDGTIYEDVRIIMADLISYSDAAQRHGWKSLQEDQLRGSAFLAYAALGRLGKIDRMNYGFDKFVADCAMVYADFGDEVDPTQTQTQGESMQL